MAGKISNEAKILGYLPNDRPPIGQTILFGFQHVLTMFPATILCALIVGFHPSTVLTFSGVSTIVALLLSRLGIGTFIPLYYGSSFSYLAALVAITGATFGQVAPDERIRIAQAGIVATGALNVIVGLIIRAVGGKRAIDKVLPPIITGSVACVIGFGLGFAALGMASGTSSGLAGDLKWWTVSIITLVVTIGFSVYLQGKGFIGMLPILLGAVVGYAVAFVADLVTGTAFTTGGLINYGAFTGASFVTTPHITFPDFTSNLTWTAIFGIGIMAIATIPESTAHLYQISLYVDHLADEMGRERTGLSKYIGFNLILDGIGDMIHGMFGATAGTNYGENNSLMVITRNYSGPALVAAGVIAILLGFSGWLAAAVSSVPTAVSGGLAIYLFGVIGMQGIALMMSEKVNLFDPKQLAIGAVIMIVGIGGNIGYSGGFLPIPLFQGIFPNGWPAIATAAVAGILLNLLFVLVRPPRTRESAEPDDLKRIEGIGLKVASILQTAGINSYAQLASTDVSKLKKILKDAGLPMVQPSSWPAQARLAAEGDWSALEAMQAEMLGGRVQPAV
ncbi:MAG TPA: solute carrier family 23 protein [Anaerolineae bacterium]|nr:solute carrier family 23 protein [Anaerolineae bacterium]